MTDENGIIAFVSNNSFINKRTFDGFRKVVCAEFNEVWVVDLKGDARTSGERRRKEGGNVFNNQIRVGVAVYFLVRKKGLKGCRIYYEAVPDYVKSNDKREFLTSVPLDQRTFEEIHPDGKHNWINLTKNNWDALLPIASKQTKTAKNAAREDAIFKFYSFGVVTNRDDWVYGDSSEEVKHKVKFLIETYNRDVAKIDRLVATKKNIGATVDTTIKWTRAVKNDLLNGKNYVFEKKRIIRALYRPFVKRHLYFSPQLNEMPNLMPRFFGKSGSAENEAIVFTDPTSEKPFMVMATNTCPDMHLVGAASGALTVALESISNSKGIPNITEWALDHFTTFYRDQIKANRAITKRSIFYYVYGVLHDPIYRERYALNLSREFPRIPLYSNFWNWAGWGKQLAELHIRYEDVDPTKLKRTDLCDQKARNAGLLPRPILKADIKNSCISIDSETILTDIPREAWDYRLGNLSAIEWVLDQYKETKPKDKTVREKFNNYRFNDYKERVIDLLFRVTTVSVRTVAVINEMRKARERN